jgi:hypothetical protein
LVHNFFIVVVSVILMEEIKWFFFAMSLTK